ncbi:hypothetical protein [Dactylosporangium salmoneum]|uniref:Uncharacterized protein n=1 Tax=Dactylosporangium salmoneum TaxID=53361 RepID=A0ABN3G6E1_9ACTN
MTLVLPSGTVVDTAARDGCAAHASASRTCGIGMTRATGHTYHHLLELLDRITASD